VEQVRIYLIRHGETIWNAARILQYPETPLSERGLEQARRLGERMRGVALERILTSDYARAHATAEAVHTTTGAPLEVHPLLRERNLGDHRGTPFADLTVDVFGADYHPPGGESWSEFHARVRRVWELIRTVAKGSSGDFAVVSHALVCRSLVEHCVPVPEALRPPEIRFGNTAVSAIDGPPWEVSLLDCTAHLEEDQVTYPRHSLGT
jgi:broad specificity phosphatase PhoE